MVSGLYGHTKTPHKKRGFCIRIGFNKQRHSAHPVIPSKAGIQKKAGWMPDQVRHDETTLMHRC